MSEASQPHNELTELQDSAARLLAADEFYTPTGENPKVIKVLTEKIGDLSNKIAVALGKLGLSAVVITPVGKLPEPDVDALTLNVPVVVQISEAVTFNQGASGTKKPALSAVVATMRILHGKPHGVTDGSPRACQFRLTETPFVLVEQEPFLTYHVNFNAVLTLP